MAKDQEIKIVPAKPRAPQADAQLKQPSYMPWLIALVTVYFVLMLLTAFLPLSGYMKVLSLILGTFLLLDSLHSLKWYIKNNGERR